MTHSTVNTELENQGSRDVAYHEINVTSLDSAGVEQYDPRSELNLDGDDRFGIDVRGQTNDSVVWSWNSTDANLSVRHMSDGTQVANNADVGHVTLEVVGD